MKEKDLHLRKPEQFHQCKGKEDCPLGIVHPPNGTEEF
jgi:hypothetical protein